MKKRWLVLATVLAFLLPRGQGVDISELEPVELVCCYQDGQLLHIRTESGASGAGVTWQEAVADLKATATGRVFLDTAQYLLVTEETLSQIGWIGEDLRPSVNLYLVTGQIGTEDLAVYLNTHSPKVTLREYLTKPVRLPMLIMEEGRYYIE